MQSNGKHEVGLLWLDNKKIPNIFTMLLLNGAHWSEGYRKTLICDNSLRQQNKSNWTTTSRIDSELESQELEDVKNEPQWYLPHHQVINFSQPENFRRKCNAALKDKCVGRNDKQIKCVDLLQNLVGINFRFHEFEIAMIADIEAKFLQIRMSSAGLKFFRFLWRKDFKTGVEVYEYTRHILVAKISPTCANHALQQTGFDNKALYPLASQAIGRNFYMDDFV